MAWSSAVERRASLENPSTSLSNPAAWLTDWAGGGKTKAGAPVSEANSMSISGVWAAVRLLANTVGMMPAITYERLPNGGRGRAPDQPSHRLLHERPNPEMTPITFKATLQAHAVMWGGGYAEIERNNADRPVALWPLLPDRTWAERRNGQKVYKIRINEGEYTYLAADRVMHIPGLSFDGVLGYNLVKVARESLGLTKAAEEFGASFFGNGSRVSGALTTDKALNDKQKANVKESWDRMHSGLSNAHRTALLEDGLKWQQIGISPDEAQFLETRRFQVTEVARWIGVPPHMIGDLERATFTNIEHQGQEFVTYALGSWLAQWEQTASYDLISEADRERYYVEFLREALLRGDSAARGQYYRELFNVGSISPNEIRERENMNPYEGGDIRVLPLNMGTPETVESGPPPSGPATRAVLLTPDGPKMLGAPTPPAVPETPVFNLAEYRERRSLDARRRHQQAQRRVFEDAAKRVVQAEVNAIRKALRKNFGARDSAGFRAWMDDYYETHGADWLRAFGPLLVTLAELVQGEVAEETGADATITPELQEFIDQYGATFAEAQVGKSVGQLQAILRETEPDTVEDAIEQRLAEWEETRPAKVAFRETVQLGNAVARFSYIAAGVLRLVWRTSGASCPLCNRLNGKVVSTSEPFVDEGDVVEPEGEGAQDTAPLTVTRKTMAPQLHGGCDCGISPAA